MSRQWTMYQISWGHPIVWETAFEPELPGWRWPRFGWEVDGTPVAIPSNEGYAYTRHSTAPDQILDRLANMSVRDVLRGLFDTGVLHEGDRVLMVHFLGDHVTVDFLAKPRG